MINRKAILIMPLVAVLAACSSPAPKSKSANLSRAAQVNAQLGSGYLAQGKLEYSKIKFEKALKQDPGLPEAHAGYGLLLARLGQIEDAEKHFKRALRKDPYNSETLNNYGTFLCGEKRFEEAEQQFMSALKDPLYKTPEFAYTNAGRCSLKSSNYDRAEAYFGKALQSNPRFPDALYELAALNDKRRNYRVANSYIQKFDDYGTHTPDSLWLAIRLAKINGDKNAQASYELLLRNKFPDSEKAALLRSKGGKRLN